MIRKSEEEELRLKMDEVMKVINSQMRGEY